MTAILRNLWTFRAFISGSVRREFQSKYLNSMLGIAWTVIQPLAMILVYTLIFSQIMRAKLPGIEGDFAYSVYLCAGILTWALFQEVTGRCQNMFLEHANLIKKVHFPRLCLPVIITLTAFLNFGIIFVLFTLFLIVSGNFPGVVYIALVPVLLVQLIFSVGLGVLLGVLNVFFRDVGQAYTVIVQFWFWLTPIVYPVSIIPEQLRGLLAYNPMVGLMTAYQTIIGRGQWPDWSQLVPMLVLGIIFCALGLRLFRSRVGEMVDEL